MQGLNVFLTNDTIIITYSRFFVKIFLQTRLISADCYISGRIHIDRGKPLGPGKETDNSRDKRARRTDDDAEHRPIPLLVLLPLL